MSTIRAIQKAKYIFTKLRIKDPSKVVFGMVSKIHRGVLHNMFSTDDINYQTGGEKEDIQIEYEGNTYLFTCFQDKTHLYYSLHQNENNNDYDCIIIIIDTETDHCVIDGISYDDKCFTNKKMDIELKKGRTLLKIALKFIDSIKKEYGLKTIYLADNSFKNCGPNQNDKIDLSIMTTLLTGDTWYGRYGFLPEDADLITKYKNNKKIVSEKRMRDVPNLKNMILEALDFHRKDQQNFKDNMMEIYEHGYKNNNRISSFLHYILKQYDRTCLLFRHFYRELYDEMELFYFHGRTFVKRI